MEMGACAHPPCVHPPQALQELPRMEIGSIHPSIHPLPCRGVLGRGQGTTPLSPGQGRTLWMAQLMTPTDPKRSWTVLGCGGGPTFPTPPPFRRVPAQSRDPAGLRDSDGDGSHPQRADLARLAAWGQDPAPALADPPARPPEEPGPVPQLQPGSSVSFKSGAAGAEFSRTQPPVPAGVRPGSASAAARSRSSARPAGTTARGGRGHPAGTAGCWSLGSLLALSRGGEATRSQKVGQSEMSHKVSGPVIPSCHGDT